MPRKPKTERTEPGFRSVLVSAARPLVTLGPEHPGWQGIPVGADGAIVRLQPPEGASDEAIAKLEADLKSVGAVAVQVDRRPRSRVVLAPQEKRPHLRARDVVLSLAHAANVEPAQKLALVGFCERCMGTALL